MDTFLPICAAFFPDCSVLAVEEIKVGHINRTYKITLQLNNEQRDFLLQSVNTYVFKEPRKVMENIAAVTEHIKSRLRFYPAADGNNFFADDSGFWRLCDYIPSVTCSTVDDLSMVREAACAFGQFQQQLSDFPAASLHETIPNFHNTRSRFAALKAAAAADSAGRLDSCREVCEALLALEEPACRLTDLLSEGKLPLRVTHNDTKINNVLFDENGHALCVIDLDTVMPGLVGHDYGDALRTAANREAEDSVDLDKVGVDVEVFRAFTEGFLSVLAHKLTQTELDTLALSFLTLSAEQAARFLTDYLQGDVYFRVEHSEHNLQRTRCQLALAQDVQRRLPQLEKIVAEIAVKYC